MGSQLFFLDMLFKTVVCGVFFCTGVWVWISCFSSATANFELRFRALVFWGRDSFNTQKDFLFMTRHQESKA